MIDWARLATALGELMILLMRRYATDDPGLAAERMVEAMKAQDRIRARAQAEHKARRRAR